MQTKGIIIFQLKFNEALYHTTERRSGNPSILLAFNGKNSYRNRAERWVRTGNAERDNLITYPRISADLK